MESPSYHGTIEASIDVVWDDDAGSAKCEYHMFRTKAALTSHGKCFQEQSRYDLDQPHTYLTLIVVCSEVFHMLETSHSCWLIQNPNSYDQELKKAGTRCCTLFLPRYIYIHGSRSTFNNSLGFNGEESGLWRFPLTGIHCKIFLANESYLLTCDFGVCHLRLILVITWLT